MLIITFISLYLLNSHKAKHNRELNENEMSCDNNIHSNVFAYFTYSVEYSIGIHGNESTLNDHYVKRTVAAWAIYIIIHYDWSLNIKWTHIYNFTHRIHVYHYYHNK